MEKDEAAEAAEANDAWKPGFVRVCVMIIDDIVYILGNAS